MTTTYIPSNPQMRVTYLSVDTLVRQSAYLKSFNAKWDDLSDLCESDELVAQGLAADLLSAWLDSEGYDDICADDLHYTISMELKRRK